MPCTKSRACPPSPSQPCTACRSSAVLTTRPRDWRPKSGSSIISKRRITQNGSTAPWATSHLWNLKASSINLTSTKTIESHIQVFEERSTAGFVERMEGLYTQTWRPRHRRAKVFLMLSSNQTPKANWRRTGPSKERGGLGPPVSLRLVFPGASRLAYC